MARKRKPKPRRAPGTGYIRVIPNGRAKAHFPKAGGGYHTKWCDSEAQAEEWLDDLVARSKEQYDVAGGLQSNETWINRWLGYQENDPDYPLKAKTLADYRFKLGYALDLVGPRIIIETKADHIDDALRLIRKSLAQNTVSQIRNLLWRAFEEAVARGYIDRNPVLRPKRRPRRRKGQDAKRKTVYRLTLQETARLLLVASSRPEYLAWWLLLCLGLREGEVIGLRRSDINLETATITIAQQYTQLEGRAYKETPKTEYSERELPFPRELVPFFREYLDWLTKRAAKALRRGTWQEHGLVFPGKSGRPMNPTSLYHMLKRMLPIAKLPSMVNVHHLRHTAAKFYTDLLAPDVIRGAIAGHSPKTITDQYGKPDLETLRPWVEQVYRQIQDEFEKARIAGEG